MDGSALPLLPSEGKESRQMHTLDASKSSSGTPISLTSPPIHADLPSSSLSNPPSPPLRRVVSSASELPRKEIKAAVFSQHVASDQYIEHHRKTLEALREAHRHERAAWNLERQELHAKVAELEAKIKRLHNAAIDGITISSLQDKLKTYSIGNRTVNRSSSTPGDYASTGASRQPSVTSSNIYQSDLDLKEKGKKSMQSIPEATEFERTKSVSFAAGAVPDTDINKALEGFAIPGHLIDKDLDGIAIKATSLPPATKKAILEDSRSGSPSPAYTPSPGPVTADSPSLKRPVTIEIPSTQQILQMPVKDLYTHAAGNTPLARLTDDDDDGSGTGGATPKVGKMYTAERERPPLEPYPSTLDGKPIRPPTERSDSYFNVPAPTESSNKNSGDRKTEEEIDQDPALTGPLIMPAHPPTLRNKNVTQGETNEFLDKLDERLTSLSRQQSHETKKSPPPMEDPSSTDPPLRIRRSINFGTQFGHGPR